jgi:hypothetical protein
MNKRVRHILRDIYSTQPGNDRFYLATATDHENAQLVSNSTVPYYSAPYALRLKFTAGYDRSVAGIRFVKADWTADTFSITAQMKTAGGLIEDHNYVNPQVVMISMMFFKFRPGP